MRQKNREQRIMGEKISALNTDLLIKSEHNKKGG